MAKIHLAILIGILFYLGVTAAPAASGEKPKPTPALTQTYSYQCLYIRANDAVAALKQILGERQGSAKKPTYTLSTDARSNTVVIKGPADKIAAAKELLTKLDSGRTHLDSHAAVVRAFTVPHGKAEQVAKALQAVVKNPSSQVLVRAFGWNEIVVLANPEEQDAIAQLLGVFGNAPSKQQVDDAKELIRITPTEFFSGELKRLKAHHDFRAAECFKIKVIGNIRCEPDVELLRNGERVDLRKYVYGIDETSDEISFTLRQYPPDKNERVFFRAAVGGYFSFARYLEEPVFQEPLKVAFGPVSISKPVELKPGMDSVVVWAMGGGHGVDLSKPAEVEQKLKRLPWAMILRLRMEKKER